MSVSASWQAPTPVRGALAARSGFAAIALLVMAAAALLAGWAPVRFSIVTVFLFAGPHNWLELRYFLTRLPARWGRLRGFFLLSLSGTVGLTAAFAALWALAENGSMDVPTWENCTALLNTLLMLWLALLVQLRSRQNPRREWGWFWSLAFVLIALAWLAPAAWGLGLVYLHPLVALWLLDRELKRSRPAWRPGFHACLVCLPVFLGLLWWKLADSAALAEDDELIQRITAHAGASVLPGLSSHLLVATHTFLEMLHYGVWVVAIPLIGLRAAPWRVRQVPLARRSAAWGRGVALFLAAGLGVVLLLWGCFLVDYTTTRTVYFTVALLHVLAEAPFLLRAL